MNNLEQFFELIENQFQYGGQKYAQTETKEATDVLFDDFGKNWLFGTIAKYVKRYSNLARERDLLKISCYMFILWLKRGFHLTREGSPESINTTVRVKSKYFNKFRKEIGYYIGADLDDLAFEGSLELDTIYVLLKEFKTIDFKDVSQKDLLEIFVLAYIVWERDIKLKGGDRDTYNEERGKNV